MTVMTSLRSVMSTSNWWGEARAMGMPQDQRW